MHSFRKQKQETAHAQALRGMQPLVPMSSARMLTILNTTEAEQSSLLPHICERAKLKPVAPQRGGTWGHVKCSVGTPVGGNMEAEQIIQQNRLYTGQALLSVQTH